MTVGVTPGGTESKDRLDLLGGARGAWDDEQWRRLDEAVLAASGRPTSGERECCDDERFGSWRDTGGDSGGDGARAARSAVRRAGRDGRRRPRRRDRRVPRLRDGARLAMVDGRRRAHDNSRGW